MKAAIHLHRTETQRFRFHTIMLGTDTRIAATVKSMMATLYCLNQICTYLPMVYLTTLSGAKTTKGIE
jgi:hypothetical protein